MNKTFKQSDNSMYTNSEFFLAKITAKLFINEGNDPACVNWGCSWQQMVYCPNLRALSAISEENIYGDVEEEYNIAYPIDGQEPEVGAIVLMRFRGTTNQTDNVFEFITAGGSALPADSCCRVLDVSCANGYLAVTYTDACVTPSSSSSPVPPPVGNVVLVDSNDTILFWDETNYVLWG